MTDPNPAGVTDARAGTMRDQPKPTRAEVLAAVSGMERDIQESLRMATRAGIGFEQGMIEARRLAADADRKAISACKMVRSLFERLTESDARERENLYEELEGLNARYYGERYGEPKHPDEMCRSTGLSDHRAVSAMIDFEERQGHKVTRATLNRIEHHDGSVGWGISVYYVEPDRLTVPEPGAGEER